MRRLLKSSLLKFMLGGSITVLCEYAVFYVLYVFLGWNLLISNSMSFVVGLGISFMFNRLWAFKKTSFKRKGHHQAILYGVLAASNLILNNIIVAGLKSIDVDPRIGKIIAIVLIAVWNYAIYHKIIFAEDYPGVSEQPKA